MLSFPCAAGEFFAELFADLLDGQVISRQVGQNGGVFLFAPVLSGNQERSHDHDFFL